MPYIAKFLNYSQINGSAKSQLACFLLYLWIFLMPYNFRLLDWSYLSNSWEKILEARIMIACIHTYIVFFFLVFAFFINQSRSSKRLCSLTVSNCKHTREHFHILFLWGCFRFSIHCLEKGRRATVILTLIICYRLESYMIYKQIDIHVLRFCTMLVYIPSQTMHISKNLRYKVMLFLEESRKWYMI